MNARRGAKSVITALASRDSDPVEEDADFDMNAFVAGFHCVLSPLSSCFLPRLPTHSPVFFLFPTLPFINPANSYHAGNHRHASVLGLVRRCMKVGI